MASFRKVDRYVSTSFWNTIAGTPARQLASPFLARALWRQLAEALRLLILDGRLALETRLPGERELATALNVSRTTIASALGLLREEGYLQSRQGSGSRIALPAGPLLPGEQTLSAPSVNLATAALSAGPEIHQAYSHALTLMPQYLSYTGYDQQGLVDLRAIIARRYSERACRRRRMK